MSGEYYGKTKRKLWRPEKRNPEKIAFFRFFQDLDLRSKEELWKTFQEWRLGKMKKELSEFNKEIKKLREEAARQIDEWPNPFKNARKGEPYTISFRLPACVEDCKFKGLDKLNLVDTQDELEPDIYIITGVPIAHGDFNIECLVKWKEAKKYKSLKTTHKYFYRSFEFRINPDPREMWKDIPTDKNLEYYKLDADSDEKICGQWRLIGASLRGRSHAHTGSPRDDDFGVYCFNGWSFLAVADGAGSAPYSRKGSEIACDVAIKTCLEQIFTQYRLEQIFENLTGDSEDWKAEARKLAYYVLPQAALEARKAIAKEARGKEREPKKYATTLLLAMVKKFPAGWIVMSFQIGDGAMAVISKKGSMETPLLLAEPDEGEYGGQTRFITMADVFTPESLMQRVRINLVPDLEAVILMSDGVSDAKFATLANLRAAKNWRALWYDLKERLRNPDPKGSLLDWLRFWSQGNHDDRTIAIMYKEERLALGVDANLTYGKVAYDE